MKPASEKLQKVLARAGFGSRRQIETWIQQGRIQVNQQAVKLGTRVNQTDSIQVDGRPVKTLFTCERQILCYHKPCGEVCTRQDPQGRTTVFDRLVSPKHGRWISVGRLDFNTAGLLLFTTDGELAHRLMHPAYTLEREYAVRILGSVDMALLERLQQGVELEDGSARFTQIVDAGGRGANHWYHVTLNEGRNHEVRRLWHSQGVTVSRLIRIRFGPITLPKGLRAGQYRQLDQQAQQRLLHHVGLLPSTPRHSIPNRR